jgi:hypothetical protein
MDKVIANVKDESSNLNILTTTLSSIVMCTPLQLEQPFASFCFGHAIAKNANMPQMTKKLCWFKGVTKNSIVYFAKEHYFD